MNDTRFDSSAAERLLYMCSLCYITYTRSQTTPWSKQKMKNHTKIPNNFITKAEKGKTECNFGLKSMIVELIVTEIKI